MTKQEYAAIWSKEYLRQANMIDAIAEQEEGLGKRLFHALANDYRQKAQELEENTK